MQTLRRLADAGRVVVVATTSPADLQLFDQVVLLTANGTPAFAGPPAQLQTALGTADWSEIFLRLSTSPTPPNRTSWLARVRPRRPVRSSPPLRHPASRSIGRSPSRHGGRPG